MARYKSTPVKAKAKSTKAKSTKAKSTKLRSTKPKSTKPKPTSAKNARSGTGPKKRSAGIVTRRLSRDSNTALAKQRVLDAKGSLGYDQSSDVEGNDDDADSIASDFDRASDADFEEDVMDLSDPIGDGDDGDDSQQASESRDLRTTTRTRAVPNGHNSDGSEPLPAYRGVERRVRFRNPLSETIPLHRGLVVKLKISFQLEMFNGSVIVKKRERPINYDNVEPQLVPPVEMEGYESRRPFVENAFNVSQERTTLNKCMDQMATPFSTAAAEHDVGRNLYNFSASAWQEREAALALLQMRYGAAPLREPSIHPPR